MRSIIDGKRYDTDTATLIHEWDNRQPRTDFRRRDKDLYRTQGGAWFIHHYGGPMTDCARPAGDGSVTGGASIEPISEDDAYAFLESHDGEHAIETFFPGRFVDA